MDGFVEKLIERLAEEKAKGIYDSDSVTDVKGAWVKAIEIVNQLAEEYNSGWIPCSDRLPEETECYLVTWRDRVTCKHYLEIVEYDASSQEWLDCICQAGLLGYDIIAWQPLPAPYVQK